jgi:hypothetical protein
MSKQSEAKAAQGYRTTQQNCGSCAHMTSERVMPTWMRADGYAVKDEYLQEKNHRCGIGGFAIKKTATCTRWEIKA